MLTNTTRTWVLGTALATVLLVVASWLLLLAPRWAEAQELRDATTAAEATNASLQVQLEQLRVEFVELPARKAELADLQQHLPRTLDLSALTRQVTAAAQASGVTLTSLAPGAPAAVAAPTDASATDAAGVVETPVTLQVVGSFAQTQAFLTALQTLPRDLLVTTVSAVAASADAPAEGGRPQVEAGDLTLDVGVTVFVLPEATADTADTAAAA